MSQHEAAVDFLRRDSREKLGQQFLIVCDFCDIYTENAFLLQGSGAAEVCLLPQQLGCPKLGVNGVLSSKRQLSLLRFI